VGREAAPADVARTHGLGRSGVTVRAHYRGSAAVSAGRVRVRRAKACRMRDNRRWRIVLSPVAGSTVPRTEKPRWRAERRRAPDVRCRRRASERDLLPSCAFRRVIPLVFEGAQGKAHFARRRGTDGAWAQITPTIWLFDNCIGELTSSCPGRGAAWRCGASLGLCRSADPGSAAMQNSWAPDLRSNTSYCIASGARGCCVRGCSVRGCRVPQASPTQPFPSR
jgi:hypothetical protein